MWIALTFVALSQARVGPIDAFRANVSAVKVAADFECRFWYNFNPANLKGMVDFEHSAGPAGEPNHLIQGRWEHVGSSERFVVRVVGGSKFVHDANAGPLPSIEALFDDEIYSYHYLKKDETDFRVHLHLEKFPTPLIGPFAWYSLNTLDRDLKLNYPGKAPVLSRNERGGRPTEEEVYRKIVGEFTVCDEIAYDPSAGYLPRYYRSVAHGMDQGRSTASVIEFYLIDALPCLAGGFVPTEWYSVRYEIDDFAAKYPDYDEKTKLVAATQSTLIHFKVNRLEEKKDDPRLEEMAGVHAILAPGGSIISKTDFAPMTLSQIKTRLGTKLSPQNRPTLPKIDEAELREFESSRAVSWLPYLFGGLAITAVGGFLIRRRSKTWIILIIIPLHGCGEQPIPRLTASFATPQVLYDTSASHLMLDIVINNTGNQALKIMKVDAGCSCRHVDTKRLPIHLRPGEQARLGVSMAGSRNYKEDNYVFTFSTDQGQLTALATLLSIPRHQLSPNSITMNGLDESSNEELAGFDLVHREVFELGSRETKLDLVLPEGLVMKVLDTHEGRMARAPGLSYRDTKYHFTLQDRSLGLHRADLVLKGAQGRVLVEAPVVWQRLPFLTSTPERTSLSTRPVRVFLRCPDDSVEFTRILSSPRGVKAELDSPRSIRVALTDDAPAEIQDFIEVGTTHDKASCLRIPVVRHASLVTQP